MAYTTKQISLGVLVLLATLAFFALRGGLFSARVKRVRVSGNSLAAAPWGKSPTYHAIKPNFPLFATAFGDEKKDCNGKSYLELKTAYQRDGGITFKSCSLPSEVLDKAKAFTGKIGGKRIQDAFKPQPYTYTTRAGFKKKAFKDGEDSVMEIAIDSDTLEFLAYLNDKKAFPFQTLNFPVGTRQPIHSDVVHFDTLPTRGLMTAAWVALEDIHPNSGPLRWYPGSHKMGIWDYDELSIRGKLSNLVDLSAKYDSDVVYEFYEREVQATIDRLQLPSVVAVLKRGETFVWAHNLLHGGSAVNDSTKSRISQVTHYWLDGAEKYWTPRVSYLSKYRLRCSQPVCHPSLHTDCAAMGLEFFKQGHSMRVEHADEFNCV
ncbi:hypothetical protein B484DRAFT_456921 [Ochromonadaceae sp. CCMP2298]|nr:hypothetical protein B484DRAFT_456921 [Ochromonadaceae sp. CCMP2298]